MYPRGTVATDELMVGVWWESFLSSGPIAPFAAAVAAAVFCDCARVIETADTDGLKEYCRCTPVRSSSVVGVLGGTTVPTSNVTNSFFPPKWVRVALAGSWPGGGVGAVGGAAWGL